MPETVDAAKRRRDYLRKWGAAYQLAALGLLVTTPCLLILLWLLLPIVVFGNPDMLYVLSSEGEHAMPISFEQWRVLQPVLILGLCSVVVVGARYCISKVHQAETLPYVPPVAEQIANLPAEEILVRGSDEPAALPAELLRAAWAGAETEAEELLRARPTPK